MKQFVVRQGLRLLALVVLGIVVGGGGVISGSPSPLAAQTLNTAEWSTLAANPQRTSWVNETTDPANMHLEWTRPIDAFIPMNAQIVGAGGLIYVTTAGGLIALYADPPGGGKSIGDVAWRFDTSMSLGNSPSIDNGTLYVAGYDKRLHALNAMTGSELWSFDLAGAGYSANPLVVDGRVLIGNRDGFFYAIGAQGTLRQGELLWKYNTGSPIRESAAYLNGTVYFAASDNRAYALDATTANATGSLRWRSAVLPSEGFFSYWPVVYRDKVIFSGGQAYRQGQDPGTSSVACAAPAACPYDNYERLQKDAIFGPAAAGSLPSAGVSPAWAQGKKVKDYTLVSDYLARNPLRRTTLVLNQADGSEYTQVVNGHTSYAPLALFHTHSGSSYPPVVDANNDMIYFNNITSVAAGAYSISQGGVLGWNLGSALFAEIGGGYGAMDEPQALSMGGDRLFRDLCCDRVGDWTSVTSALNSSGAHWSYGVTLKSLASNYDTKWWGIDIASGLPGLTGNYGTVNGEYHQHGQQNPLVPYHGQTFSVHRNAVVAFGTLTARGQLATVPSVPSTSTVPTPTSAALTAQLETEVQKIVTAGNLQPGYYNTGQLGPKAGPMTFFENPGETLQALTLAYPYLSAGLQASVKTYLQTQWATYFNPTLYSRIGWSEGSARAAQPIPPDVQASMNASVKSTFPGGDWDWTYPWVNFYAMWQYAKLQNDPTTTSQAYALMKPLLEAGRSVDSTMLKDPVNHPYAIAEYNGIACGEIAFLNLQTLAGQQVADSALRTKVQNDLANVEGQLISNFSENSPYVDPSNPDLPLTGGPYHYRWINTTRNWLYMCPELGSVLKSQIGAVAQTAIADYQSADPYWFVERYDAAPDEGAQMPPLEAWAMMAGKADVLGQSYSELSRYLDAPAFVRGDLFYVQNLVTILSSSVSQPPATSTATPPLAGTPTPTPTSTPTPTQPPDAVGISGTHAASGRAYQWANPLATGSREFVDRAFTFTSVPSKYAGLQYLQTANDDKTASTAGTFLSFAVDRPVTVYVAYDQRISQLPSWLAGFTATGDTLASGGATFRVYARGYPAGTVTLGSNAGTLDTSSMYSVLVRAASTGTLTPTASPTSGTLGAVGISGTQASSGRAYRWVNTLATGASLYIDRAYTFTSVPAAYAGLQYLQTANDDKTASAAGTFLSFTVDRSVTVYVAYDQRISQLPSWLAGFTATTDTVGGGGAAYRVYARDYPAGPVTLGSNAGSLDSSSMYSVVVRAASTGTATPTPTSRARPTPTTPPTRTPTSTPVGTTSQPRQVNVPLFTGNPDAQLANTGLVWFGNISSSSNYSDVRFGYTATDLYVRFQIVDSSLWYDPTHSPSALTSYDSATLLLDVANAAGAAPADTAYRFDAELNWWEPRDAYQAAYRGTGAGWTAASSPFTTSTSWRGDQPNDAGNYDRGWTVIYHVPFASLGLGGPPSSGALWRLGLVVHDRDSAAGPPRPDSTWPETASAGTPSSWGQLAFGLPVYTPVASTPSGSVTIRQGLNGAVVRDGEVGGGTNCGYGMEPFWDTVPVTNYAGQEQINVQNEGDIADWPCFAKYYVTFPLSLVPPGKVIRTATLTLHQFGNSGGGSYGPPPDSIIQVFSVRDDWDPATLTWNTAPLAQENVSRALVQPLATFPGWPGVARTWDVGGAVAKAVASGQPLRLALYSADDAYSTGKYFSSSETPDWNAAARPTLDVTWGDP